MFQRDIGFGIAFIILTWKWWDPNFPSLKIQTPAQQPCQFSADWNECQSNSRRMARFSPSNQRQTFKNKHFALKLPHSSIIMCTYCVISATSFRLQTLMTGSVASLTSERDTFVLTRLVAINATKYVDIFGVIWKSSRIYSELGILARDNQHENTFNEFFV